MEPISGETTLERAMLKQASDAKHPINGSLELLPLCNMNCDMCYVRLSRSEMERQGRLRTPQEWLTLGEQMQQAGVLFLLLTGGEPLLYPGFEEVYLGLKRLGMVLTINTNGTLIDEKWAVFFGKHKPRRINITLYGASNDTYDHLCHYPGGFDKVISGIRLLQSYGIDIKVSGSLTRANLTELDCLHAIGEELGVPVRIDTYMMPASRERDRNFDLQSRLSPEQAAQARINSLIRETGAEAFPDYARSLIGQVDQATSDIHPQKAPQMSCLAGSCSFTVNWQGKMRPCVVMSEPSVPVFELGFQQAWKTLRQKTDQILLNPTCASCTIKPLCRTCAASALLETGSYDGIPDYMCRYAKESLRLLRHWTESPEQIVNAEIKEMRNAESTEII